MKADELCVGCGHFIKEHFNDVTGVARCLHVDSGVSSSGIIGEPWSQECDCVNFTSEWRKRRQEEKEREDAERSAAMDAIVANVKARKAAEIKSEK